MNRRSPAKPSTRREPNGVLMRLNEMSQRPSPSMHARLGVMVVMLLSVMTPAAHAQQSPISIEATVGIEGWVAGNDTTPLTVTIGSDLLVAGALQITYGDAITRVPVDIPAGGSKAYDVGLRTPFRSGTIQIDLLDGDGRRLGRDSVRPLVAVDEVVVGVSNDAELITRLSAVQTANDGLAVTPV
jgi:hypothetical protein